MGRIGIAEILLILLVVVLLFGVKKLPEIGSAIGKAIKEFKKASREVEEGISEKTREDKNDRQA
ncbi:MAG: twin-arginine translocase TatA/TatE family subunit [Candidatus Omnitrophota bacterium]